jgi:hypothetical protein
MNNKILAQISSIHGTPMIEVSKVYLKEGEIAMDGNVMGTMPGSFYVKPIDLYKMSKMVDGKLIRSIPRMLRQGKKEYKTAQVKKGETRDSDAK